MRRLITWALLVSASLAHGGEPEVVFADGFEDSFTVGGTVAGLQGDGMILRLNDTEDLPITMDGPFTFSTRVPAGGDWQVVIDTQPLTPEQYCALARSSGTDIGAPVTDVQVSCGANWDEFNWDEADWN